MRDMSYLNEYGELTELSIAFMKSYTDAKGFMTENATKMFKVLKRDERREVSRISQFSRPYIDLVLSGDRRVQKKNFLILSHSVLLTNKLNRCTSPE